MTYKNCYFEKYALLFENGGMVDGCTFTDSSYAILDDGGSAINNYFYGSALFAINITTGSNMLAGGNVGYGVFGTFINDNGTSTVLYNNNDQ